jgi:hypothetical protein
MTSKQFMHTQTFEVKTQFFISNCMSRKLSKLSKRFPSKVTLEVVSYKEYASIVRSFIIIKSEKKNYIRIVNMYLKSIGNIKRIIDNRFLNTAINQQCNRKGI